jgi:hypothetical protein
MLECQSFHGLLHHDLVKTAGSPSAKLQHITPNASQKLYFMEHVKRNHLLVVEHREPYKAWNPIPSIPEKTTMHTELTRHTTGFPNEQKSVLARRIFCLTKIYGGRKPSLPY